MIKKNQPVHSLCTVFASKWLSKSHKMPTKWVYLPPSPRFSLLIIKTFTLNFFLDGRLRSSGGHQADHQAVCSHQQPLPLQHNDYDVTQSQNWIKVQSICDYQQPFPSLQHNDYDAI